MTPGYVFISYSSKEYAQANELRQLLQNNGISCWMAPESIASGSNYATAIPSAIRGCSVFLLLLTQASQESRWVPREVDVAINSGKRIIPYMIQNCPITDTFDFYLIGVQRLEGFRSPADAQRQLIGMLRQEVGSSQGMGTIQRSPAQDALVPPHAPYEQTPSSLCKHPRLRKLSLLCLSKRPRLRIGVPFARSLLCGERLKKRRASAWAKPPWAQCYWVLWD